MNREEECWDWFHVTCDCGTPDHALDVHIGVNSDRFEPDWPFTEVEIYVTTYTPWFGWGWGRFPKRISRALKLLFTGVVEMEHTIHMRGEAAANLGQALIDGVKKADDNVAKVKAKQNDKALKPAESA